MYHQPVPGKRGTILIVDDNQESAQLIADLVVREGFRPLVASTGAGALESFMRARPVAVVLDWVLPDLPGTEVCRGIRAESATVPILFVSGRDDETSVVRALDAGADDFLTKPVQGGELVARLESNLRKVGALQNPPGPHVPEVVLKSLRFGTVHVDLGAHEVSVDQVPVRLGPLEFKLLEYLARNSGVAVSRDQIMNEVYGYDADITTERVDLLVRRVRAKLGDHDGGYIAAVPGFGYRLERRVSALTPP